jgi:hypothetical protein
VISKPDMDPPDPNTLEKKMLMPVEIISGTAYTVVNPAVTHATSKVRATQEVFCFTMARMLLVLNWILI